MPKTPHHPEAVLKAGIPFRHYARQWLFMWTLPHGKSPLP